MFVPHQPAPTSAVRYFFPALSEARANGAGPEEYAYAARPAPAADVRMNCRRFMAAALEEWPDGRTEPTHAWTDRPVDLTARRAVQAAHSLRPAPPAPAAGPAIRAKSGRLRRR